MRIKEGEVTEIVGDLYSDICDGSFIVEFCNRRKIRDLGELNKERLIARPIWLLDTSPWSKGPTKMWCFYSPSEVEGFMMWREPKNYTLYVGRRQYDWPATKVHIEEHIRECIDIEAAFYDNGTCCEWLEKQREKKTLWTQHMNDE